MNDCNACIKRANRSSQFNTCGFPQAEWFPMGVIRFCRPQNLFLIEHLDPLRDGRYPRQPRETGYTDPAVRTQPRQCAPYERAAQIAAELDWRLGCCGRDGKILEYGVQLGKPIEPEGWTALNYISGSERKCDLSTCPACGGKLLMSTNAGGLVENSEKLTCHMCGKTWSVKALKHRDYSQWKSHKK